MKKLKLFTLSILVLLGSVLFSACVKNEIKAESLEVSETSLTLRLGETVYVDVNVFPIETSNKQFEIYGSYQNVVAAEVDYSNMQIKITAKSEASGDMHTIMGVRTLDGSYKEKNIAIEVVDNEENVAIPSNLSFDGQYFSWNTVDRAKSYTLTINGEDKVTESTQFELNLDDYAGKQVTAKIKANGKSKNLDSDYSSEISFEIFDKPTNVKLNVEYNDTLKTEVKTLTWDAVESAETYSVLVNSRVIETSQNSLDVTSELETPLSYAIKVKVNTNLQHTKFNSAYSTEISFEKLDSPSNLTITNGILRWNTVAGAKGYKVFYTYAEPGLNEIKENTVQVSNTYFELPFNIAVGSYIAKVSSVGDEEATLSSNFGFEIIYTKLDSVKNIRVEEGNIVWDSVEYATSYIVYLNNILDESGNITSVISSQTQDASNITFNLSQFGAGDYEINVQPIGTDNKIPGNKMEQTFLVSKLATPTNLQVSKNNNQNTIQWNKVDNATSYEISIENSSKHIFNIEQTSTDIVAFDVPNVVEVGSNIIIVKALGGKINNIEYINSNASNQVLVNKLQAPSLVTTNLKNSGVLSWNKISDSSSYTVLIKQAGSEDLQYNVTTTSIDFVNSEDYHLNAGNYQVFVKANASDNQNFLDSEFCNVLTVTKLSTKTINVKNGTVENLIADENSNVEYKYKINGSASLRNTIKDYVDSVITENTSASIEVIAMPKSAEIDDIYYICSDASQKTYIYKLPTIKDIKMIDGYLYYGSIYERLSGYEFKLYLDASTDSEQTISVNTNTNYNFNSISAGSHKVKIQAFSVQNDDASLHNESNPFYLNSYVSNEYSFLKLDVPQDFKITSFASDVSTNLYITLNSANNYNIKNSGALVWDKVANASNYELMFTSDNVSLFTDSETNYHSLQNTSILAGGTKTVKIRALGNGTNIISSDISEDSLSFTKLYSPNSLSIEVNEKGEKIAVWTYANGQDPNANLSATSLISNNLSAAIHIFVDGNGNYYSAINIDGLTISGSNPLELLNSINKAIDTLKANKCVIPNSLSGNATLKVIAVPLNSFIDFLNTQSYDTLAKVDDSVLKAISDYSPEINLERLQTPLQLKLEDNILSWSALRYNNNTKAQNALSEYRITLTGSKDENDDKKEYIFSISTTNTSYPTVIVDSLVNPENCVWEFSKDNFDSLFGAGNYVPDVYSISIQAISNNSYYTEGNKKVYYIDSTKSSAINVEVLSSPSIGVVNGVIEWTAIPNVSKYGIYLIMPNGTKQYIESEETNLTLQSTQIRAFPAGLYKLDVISLGDGQSTITSEVRSESDYSRFTKLQVVEGLKVENGVIKYSSHAINSADYEACEYTMFIRYGSNLKYEEYSNKKYLSFELSDNSKFPGDKQYFISVRATGDNTQFINSDLCEEISAYKFAMPSNLKIVDGKLVWDRVSGITKFLITISGGEYTLDNELNISAISNSYAFDGIPYGTYKVYVKAVGDSTYLNSSAASYTVEKLHNVEEFKIVDGYLTWKYTSGSNYKLSIDNSKEITINDSDAQIVTIENEKFVQYRLSDIDLDDSEHNIYIYNYGATSKISSSPTETIKIKKLDAPTNLMVDNELLVLDENEKEKFKFKGVDGRTVYAIKIKVTLKNDDIKEFVYLNSVDEHYEEIDGYLTIDFSILQQKVCQGLNIQLTSISAYNITVVAIGDTSSELSGNELYYLASNDSQVLKIEQPSATELSFDTDSGYGKTSQDGVFYGKIIWTKVEDADYYKVFVNASVNEHKVLFGYDLNEPISDENDLHYGYACYIVSNKDKTFANVAFMDNNYSFIVVACKNKDGFDSEDSNKLSNLSYNLYNGEQNGLTVETAYQIANEVEYGYIKYNLEAYYKLTDNIEFNNQPESIGTKQIPFTGNFDGGNYILSGKNGEPLVIDQNNNTFDGLFGVIGINGEVKNFTLVAEISSVKIEDNVLNVSFVARQNYGKIYNVTTIGKIETVNNSDTYSIYAAGIAIDNYGTIEYCLSSASINPVNGSKDVYSAGIAVFNHNIITKSGFVGNATGQIAAGIVAINYAEVTECYYENNDGELNIDAYILSQNRGINANYAGGIVAYMDGENAVINYCYSNAKVTATTNSAQTAYVGGLVGYLKNGTLKNSYAIGYKNSEALIYATGKQPNTISVGVIAGAAEVKNNKGSNVVYVKLSTQKIVGNGSLMYVEGAEISALKEAIQNFTDYPVYFDISTIYPKLIRAKK